MHKPDSLKSVVGIISHYLKSCITSNQKASDEIDLKAPFSAFKFNKSEFLKKLEKQFKLTLPPQSLWEYPHIEEYAQYIAEQLGLIQQEETATFIKHDHLQKQEPIAIIGLGCRFPGGVHNVHDFWDGSKPLDTFINFRSDF